MLVEGADRVLLAFPPSLSEIALCSLKGMGVEVWLGKKVTDCDADGITASGERLPAATVLWAAGITASPAATWLGASSDRAGRVQVRSDLSVPGRDNIFVIGDTAAFEQSGALVPGIAPAAKQEGHYVAGVIRSALQGRTKPRPFHYRHYGNLATIGRNSAVIDMGWLRLHGFFAWFIWGVAHIYFLIGNRNRLLVALQWLYSYCTFGRGARLIVGADADRTKR